MNGKKQSLRAKILSGYYKVIVVIVILAVYSQLAMTMIDRGYQDVSDYQSQQCMAQQVIAAHYKWLDALNASILTGVEFTGGLDPDTCSLGKWIKEHDLHAMGDQQMSAALAELIEPHKEIHSYASELIELSKTDPNAAFSEYTHVVKPKVQLIGEKLDVISSRFQAIADQKVSHMRTLVVLSFVLCIGLGVLAVVWSLILGGKVSRKIAQPVSAVADWSELLSSGVDNLVIDDSAQKADNAIEIDRMINSFRDMANGIQGNVAVIRRVAEGDLTAYVDIRSDGDSLGKNLYHMVQNNDQMFANMLQVADSVAINANSIAQASQLLAESSTNQAAAVEALSYTVQKADSLALENMERANQAATVTQEIKAEISSGNDSMSQLVKAVDEIRSASDQISSVMKDINDIAFQTNILALNAAVEAARAGAAGKGFAVVADEVRNLSLKSGEAADRSRLLIENTINKTKEGSRISRQTFEMFGKIVESTDRITGVVNGIAGASANQQAYIEQIHDEIDKISDVVSSNAATSEETAAATEQMNRNANLIHQEMSRFQLRRREAGKPYIPPEKADDPDFVRQAYANYERAQRERGQAASKSPYDVFS